jgi:hypothetical protein
MEDLKPDNEGQPATLVAEPQVMEMTEAEIVKRIESDPKFATDYLDGRLKFEEVKTEPDAPAPEAENPPAKAEAPAPAPQTPVADDKKHQAVSQTDDGKFEVTFDDGSRQAYKTKGEALKGLKEKELMIRRQKGIINEMRERETQMRADLEALKAVKPSEAPAPAPVAQPKPAENPKFTDADKAAEVLDPYDPEYLKKLSEKLQAQEREIERLKESDKKRGEEWEKEKADSKKRTEVDEARRKREESVKSEYGEAESFIRGKEDFNIGKPVEVFDGEYREFLDDLGQLAGTNGDPRQNLAVMDIFLNQMSEKGKLLRAEAEKIGLRSPENLDRYFKLLNLIAEKRRLKRNDPVSGKEVPFTLEETYRYLTAMGGESASPSAPEAPPQQPSPSSPADPRAQALLAAEEQKKRFATDLPTGASSANVDSLTESQLGNLLDMPRNAAEKAELLRDPVRRQIWQAAFKKVGLVAPRLDGV